MYGIELILILPVNICTEIEHGVQEHTLSRSNQPIECLAPLQKSSRVTVENLVYCNDETSASSVRLGNVTPRDENYEQGHEITR